MNILTDLIRDMVINSSKGLFVPQEGSDEEEQLPAVATQGKYSQQLSKQHKKQKGCRSENKTVNMIINIQQ